MGLGVGLGLGRGLGLGLGLGLIDISQVGDDADCVAEADADIKRGDVRAEELEVGGLLGEGERGGAALCDIEDVRDARVCGGVAAGTLPNEDGAPQRGGAHLDG